MTTNEAGHSVGTKLRADGKTVQTDTFVIPGRVEPLTVEHPAYPTGFYVNVPGPGDDPSTFPRVYVSTSPKDEYWLPEHEFISLFGRDQFAAVYRAAYGHTHAELREPEIPYCILPDGQGGFLVAI